MSVIEFTIPLRYMVPSSDDEDETAAPTAPAAGECGECVICMHRPCTARDCCRSPTKTSCCSQALCCGCFVKLMRRCKCSMTCREIVGVCPFCRDTMRAETTLQVFMSTIPVCTRCQAKQRRRRSLDATPPTTTSPPTSPPTTTTA